MFVGGGSAVAGKFVTSRDIKDGTIQTRDLSKSVRHQLARVGKSGKDGTNGTNGVNGKDGAKGDQASAIPADFSFTNASLELTQAGVKFGPYADGGAAGGSLRYDGLNGRKLSEITNLVYTAKYATDDHNDVAVPYLRVFVNDHTHDVIYSPNTQQPLLGAKPTAEAIFLAHDVRHGTVRYDDDTGNGPDQSWDSMVAAHGNDVISGIYISAGFSAGKNLRAFVSDMTVGAGLLTGSTYHFGN